MQDYETGYQDYPEAPEMTDAELEQMFVDQLEETAPEVTWTTCYCDDDMRCHVCTEERDRAYEAWLAARRAA